MKRDTEEPNRIHQWHKIFLQHPQTEPASTVLEVHDHIYWTIKVTKAILFDAFDQVT